MKDMVLDLFCGMGGLSLGFAQAGFLVVGYDKNPWVPVIFRVNGIGDAVRVDLSRADAILSDHRKARVVIGGPPCRPWSPLNRRRPGKGHPDHPLVRTFFQIIRDVRPEALLMENVPLLADDPEFRALLLGLSGEYDLECRVVCYADYGAATKRKRLIVVGFRKGVGGVFPASRFFDFLEAMREPPKPVIEAVHQYIHLERGAVHDHEWPALRTVGRYEGKYRARRFGWARLEPHLPAPSFGNITKTYVLHPLAGVDGFPLRVLSVREAMAVMGFPDGFRFPNGMGLRTRYQMVADAVTPVFSKKCAQAILRLIG